MRWEKAKVVRISETRVIIHTFLNRMCQKRAFAEEVGAGENASEIREEMYEEKIMIMSESDMERRATEETMEAEVVADILAEADRLLILDWLLKNGPMNASLQQYLKTRFARGEGQG